MSLLLSSICNTAMLRIWIPGYEQAVLKVESFNIFYFVENSFIFCILQENGKPFTVYKIHVATTTGRYFILSKRYSSIHELYLKCKERYFVNVPFPPKKLSNSSTKVCVIRNISFLVLYYFLQDTGYKKTRTGKISSMSCNNGSNTSSPGTILEFGICDNKCKLNK